MADLPRFSLGQVVKKSSLFPYMTDVDKSATRGASVGSLIVVEDANGDVMIQKCEGDVGVVVVGPADVVAIPAVKGVASQGGLSQDDLVRCSKNWAPRSRLPTRVVGGRNGVPPSTTLGG